MEILDYLVHGAEWFIGLFREGADTFTAWMTGIVPLVLVLLIAMNSLIALIGEERINKLAAKAGKNPAELFVWMGIAQGIMSLGLNTGDLAVRYLLLGAVLNFFGGWVTDFTTKFVAKQQGVTLSTQVKASHV